LFCQLNLRLRLMTQFTPASLALIFMAMLERYWSLGCPGAPIPDFGDEMHWLGIPRKESVARFTSE